MSIHIDLATAVRIVDQAVAEKPEGFIYVNNKGQQAGQDEHEWPLWGCDYFTEEGEGSCLVGKVFIGVGLKPSQFSQFGTGGFAYQLLNRLESADIITVDEDAHKFLVKVQYCQDRGYTWAKAAEQAKERVKSL